LVDIVEKKVDVKNRRFLSSDYDFIADKVDKEIKLRKSLKQRTAIEPLWEEVDRQVMMKPMEVKKTDPDDDWMSALELGDLSTASEVLSADVMRLIFPQERSWMQAHVKVDFDRLQTRQAIEEKQLISDKEKAKIQKKTDAELRAFMTQQHTDFGLKARVELSIKEALHHGSFVAEVEWQENQQYAMGGAFKSSASPVWIPHSMWHCYPETLELGTDLIYRGSMIIESEKEYDWVLRQNFINLRKFQDSTSSKTAPVKLATWYGDITIERKGDNIFLPNMKVIVANKTVLFAKPKDNISIIYGGYDRIDVRNPYYMSPLVKQSPNHKIVTILANSVLDAARLKLDPPGTYDGNDPRMIQDGGPKNIPGWMTPTKGAVNNTKYQDIGDPSWAINALTFFKGETKEGLGVTSQRAGGERQADRVTATQIESEDSGAEIRTIDFTGKIEKGIRAYLYIQHELNKRDLKTYSFYNPEMGMKDFEVIEGKDLPDEVHFEVIGSKGVLTERRRANGVMQVTGFLSGNEQSANVLNMEEIAMTMYTDVGVKNPERLLNIADENDKVQVAVAEVQAAAQEIIEKMQAEASKVAKELINKTMELKPSDDRLELRNERSQGTENHLRETIQQLKSQMGLQAEFLQNLGKIKDEKDKLDDVIHDIEHAKEVKEAGDNKPETEKTAHVTVIVEKTKGFDIERDDNDNMKRVVAIE